MDCGGKVSDQAEACLTCGRPVARRRSGSASSTQYVVVSDVEMKFGSMVQFMVQWVFASIPAAFIVTLIALGVAMVLALAAGAIVPR